MQVKQSPNETGLCKTEADRPGKGPSQNHTSSSYQLSITASEKARVGPLRIADMEEEGKHWR